MPTNNELWIAVCDDMENDRVHIADLTKQILQQAQIPHRVCVYESGKDLLADIRSGMQYQILVLDVMMAGMDGMELAAELRKQENNAAIIFASINREMALYGYEVSAVRYLAKPLEQNKLKEALLHCWKLWEEKKEILLPTDQGQYRTSFAEIQFVEAFDRGTRFVLADETVESRLKFKEVEAMLPGSAFLRCHRGFIVNLAWVKYIRNYEFLLKSGKTVPISKNRYSEIYRKFVNYIAA